MKHFASILLCALLPNHLKVLQKVVSRIDM